MKLAALTLGLATCALLSVAGPVLGASPPHAPGALAALLAAHPIDDALLERALTIALEAGVLESVLAELSMPGAGPAHLHAAARLAEESGQGARAFDLYEAALAADAPLAASRARLVTLLLHAGWEDRALEVWRAAPLPAESPELTAWLDYRLALARRAEDAVVRTLLETRGVSLLQAARWAEEAGHPGPAARLYEAAGLPAAAVHAWLQAGELETARARATPDLRLDPATALALARLTGERAPLETALDGRTDEAAERLRTALDASLGRTASAASPHAADPASDDMSPDVAQNGVPDAGTEAAAYPHESAPPQTAPPNVESPASDREHSARHAAARAIRLSGSAHDAQRAQLAEPGDPSLEVALAWLTLHEPERARREWTRWRLQPFAGDRDLLPRLRRAAPDWFMDEGNADAALARAELLAVLPVAGDTTDPAGARVGRALQRALHRATPGSPTEAALLFHRGRLLHMPTDLQRAAGIAPALAVAIPTPDGRLVRPLADAVAALQAPATARPGFIEAPDPIDEAVGSSGPRVLRVARTPSAVSLAGPWHLAGWQDEPDPTPGTPAFGRLARLAWDAGGAEIPGQGRWDAGALAPLHTALALPRQGWLLAGRGLAWLDPHGAERLRLEHPEPCALVPPPPFLADLLGEAVHAFLASLEPPAPHAWEAGDPWLARIRQRQLEPALGWAAVLVSATGSTGPVEVVARAPTGERLRFVRSSWGNPAPADAPLKFPEYARLACGAWRRTDPAPQSSGLPGATPVPAPAPHEAASAHATSLPVRLERAQSWSTALPSCTAPELWPLPPEPARRMPDALAAHDVIARAGPRPEVWLTSSGWLAVFDDERSLPTWLLALEPPLPGRGGYRAYARPRTSIGQRTPLHTGPMASAACPRVLVTETGGIEVIAADLVRWRPGTAPRTVHLADPLRVTRDAAHDRIRGSTWLLVLPGDRLLEITAAGVVHVHPAPAPGGFDLVVAGDDLYLLGLDPGPAPQHALRRRTPDGSWQELALPNLLWEGDRADLQLAALGCWEAAPLLLHDRLWLGIPYPSMRPDGTHDADAQRPLVDWRLLASWPGQDPWRFACYLQTAPLVLDGRLRVSRPWGVIEEWREAAP